MSRKLFAATILTFALASFAAAAPKGSCCAKNMACCPKGACCSKSEKAKGHRHTAQHAKAHKAKGCCKGGACCKSGAACCGA